MVLIFAPVNNEVKNIKIIGTIFIIIKKINFLSLNLIFVLNFEIINENKIKKGINIPICFPKKIKG